MAAIDPHVVRVVCEYVKLICKARALLHRRRPSLSETEEARCYLAAAGILYETAPRDAYPHLDAVRRVMELAPAEQSVGKVLLTASVLI